MLLFGEYTVTLGSGALAIPHTGFSGHWAFGPGLDTSKAGLRKLHTFISGHPEWSDKYQLDVFDLDLNRDLYFDADIPAGYGLGSSGAVVAAFYDAYCISPAKTIDVLKSELSHLENAFHGSSSGIDALVSYLNASIQIQEGGGIDTPLTENRNENFFLLDTGISRSTSPLVSLFRHKLGKNTAFHQAVEALASQNRNAIGAYLSGNKTGLFDAVDAISRIQFTHFKEMIPPSCVDIWSKGIHTNTFRIKLCGAGGGGMMLGMVQDKYNIPDELYSYNISFIQ